MKEKDSQPAAAEAGSKKRKSPEANGIIEVKDAEAAPVRRSTRAKKPSFLAQEIEHTPEPKKPPPDEIDTPRRNPKRKAAPETFSVPEHLLEESLAPIRLYEQAEWDSWIELESDPAFFNVIVKDLGVKDVKVQELLGIDEESLGFLPKPVHGLVFLYQYVEEDGPEATEDGKNVWFANQTTDNACATVALLNILMNAQDIEIGDMLKQFKAESAGLDPPMRGHLLSNNAAIRMAHNTFARRLDFLNADLLMDNEVQDFKKKRPKTTSSRSSKKKKKPSTDAAFHFIAYVPVGGKVWQLDGLESHPMCIGDYEEDWTVVARPYIEARMLQYETNQVSFNLVALCRSPLNALRTKLLINIKSLSLLEDRMRQKEGWPAADSRDDHIDQADSEKLLKYGLTRVDIAQSTPSPKFAEKIKKKSFELPEALDLRQKLLEEQTQLRSEYAAELTFMEDDVGKSVGRKNDYTPAIHEWVKKLAEHGVLQELRHEADTDALLH